MTSLGMIGSSAETFIENLFGMSHHFIIVIDNPTYDLGSWQKASGLTVSWEMATYRAGDQGNEFWIYPGTTKYEKITLTRPVSPTSNVTQAWLAATSANMMPLSGAILLCGPAGIPIITWRLYQFFPVSWRVGEFSAAEAKVVTETLELAHTGFLEDQIASKIPGAIKSRI
ncbi:MAG TPA: phage tail protein [Streptosporangiaceae bacterium]|jgi:phage tail-like protein|nr:phage tail protein [Streptosporangiaceae bacterium]